MKRFYIPTAAAALALPLVFGGCSLTDILQDDWLPPAVQETLPDARELRERYDGYGFRGLQTETEQQLYAAIDETVQRLSSREFRIDRMEDTAKISDVLEFYKDDHPEVFWIDETEPYYYSDLADSLVIELNFKLEGDALSTAKAELEEALQAILSAAPQDTAYDKELFVHDRLIEGCEYDDEALELHKTDRVHSNEQNAYGALVEGKAVCEGYARAFQLLCQRLGVNCWVVQGKADGFEGEGLSNHIWNCVELDGDWYQVDVTWDDVENEELECERYLYFNLTTDEIQKDHFISPHYSEYTEESVWYNAYIPACESTEYCYLTRHSAVLDNLDSDELPAYLTKAASRQADSCMFLVDGALDFDDTFDKIVQSYAYEWITQANSANGNNPQLTESCTVTGMETRRVIVLVLDYQS